MHYLILFFTFLFINVPTETKELTVTITNIKSIEGHLIIGLFNNGDRFLESGQAYRRISVEVQNSIEVVVIKDLPPGDYAISLYHDRNSNGICDRNFFGIPKEPYAFSNNIKPKFTAPTFVDCKFELMSDDSQKIKLIH